MLHLAASLLVRLSSRQHGRLAALLGAFIVDQPVASISGHNHPSTPITRSAATSSTRTARAGEAPILVELANRGIHIADAGHIDVEAESKFRTVCPMCQGGSKTEKCLSVNIQQAGNVALFYCFRASCGWTGTTRLPQGLGKKAPQESSWYRAADDLLGKHKLFKTGKVEKPYVKPKLDLKPLSAKALHYFETRGISPSTLEKNGVAATEDHRGGEVIAFPYYRDNEIVNVKHRKLPKTFWQAKDAEKVFYGLDDIKGVDSVIIVEGELDKLSLNEAGIWNVISVPDGAPSQVKEGLPEPMDDVKFSYLHNCDDLIERQPPMSVILATDNDAPGVALAEELARRLGRERCYRVRWPDSRKHNVKFNGLLNESQQAWKGTDGSSMEEPSSLAPATQGNGERDSSHVGMEPNPLSGASTLEGQGTDEHDNGFRKDANEVLVKDGPEALRLCLRDPKELPIKGLFRFHEFYDEIFKTLHIGTGFSTGWVNVDKLYTVVPGELTIVTGIPNSGKSEWLDALSVNLAQRNNWSFAFCSMEKTPRDHASHLIEKYIGKPFFNPKRSYAEGVSRMGPKEVFDGLEWIGEHMHLIQFGRNDLPSIDWVLERAKSAVLRYGIRGLVIDPYSELSQHHAGNLSETEYVSEMLTKIKRFTQHNNVHVWFVAHPKQQDQYSGEPPSLYDISGSAHFINKADNGIVVHRKPKKEGDDDDAPQLVDIVVQKVRNKVTGSTGRAILSYSKANGRYTDFWDEDVEDLQP